MTRNSIVVRLLIHQAVEFRAKLGLFETPVLVTANFEPIFVVKEDEIARTQPFLKIDMIMFFVIVMTQVDHIRPNPSVPSLMAINKAFSNCS